MATNAAVQTAGRVALRSDWHEARGFSALDSV